MPESNRPQGAKLGGRIIVAGVVGAIHIGWLFYFGRAFCEEGPER